MAYSIVYYCPKDMINCHKKRSQVFIRYKIIDSCLIKLVSFEKELITQKRTDFLQIVLFLNFFLYDIYKTSLKSLTIIEVFCSQVEEITAIILAVHTRDPISEFHLILHEPKHSTITDHIH